VAELSGFSKMYRKWVARRSQAQRERLNRMDQRELMITLVEEEELEKLNKVSKLLYKIFVKPLKRTKSMKAALPQWVDYFTYFIALTYCGVCAWYTLSFSIYLNECGSCKCSIDTCGNDEFLEYNSEYPTCSTCPTSMISQGPDLDGDWLAVQWIQTVLITLVLGFFFTEPGAIMMKRAVVPFFANQMVMRERKRLGEQADMIMAIDEKVESKLVEGPVYIQKGDLSLKAKRKWKLGAAKVLAANEAGEGKIDLAKTAILVSKSKPGAAKAGGKVVPFDPESKDGASPENDGVEEMKEAMEGHVRCKLGCGKWLPEDDPFATEQHELEFCPERLVACSLQCGEVVSEKDRVLHEAAECQERNVQCKYCQRVMKEKRREAHESSMCPLLQMCRCGQHVLKEDYKLHQETSCPFRAQLCRFGCGRRVEELQRQIHETVECDMRIWECFCGEKLPFKDKELHETAQCPERVVTCAGCGSEMVEADRREHEADHCPERPWKCQCGVVVPFRKKNHHETKVCTDPIEACLNSCGFYGKRSERVQHEAKDCNLRMITCDCGIALQAKRLKKHQETECQERDITCSLCNVMIKAKDLESHTTSSCLQRVIPCRQGCGRAVPAAKIELHETKTCPERLVPCKICSKELPFRTLTAHEKSMCRVLPCPQCGLVMLKSDHEKHKDDCPKKLIHCNRCNDFFPITAFHAHEKSECPLRIVICERCGDALHANALSDHQANACLKRLVACRNGCGEKLEYQNKEVHETRTCKLATWMCQCGQTMRLFQRKTHLRQCRSYVECWERVLQKLVEGFGKGSLERRLAKLMSTRKIAPEIALCALGESHGDVKMAFKKLSNRAYYEEMKLVCEVCDIKRYVSAKRRKKKKTPEKTDRDESHAEEKGPRSFDPGSIDVLSAHDVKEDEKAEHQDATESDMKIEEAKLP